MNTFYRGFVKDIILPFYDGVRGTKRGKYRKNLEKNQWKKKKEIEQDQLSSLKKILKYSYENVPYYNRLFKDNKLKPEDIRKIEDLEKIPVLTKNKIQDFRQSLISSEYKPNELIPDQSGGTGNSINFMITHEKLSWELGAEFRAYKWAGYELGDKCLQLWGSPHEISKQQYLLTKITNYIERKRLISTYILTEKKLEEQIKFFRKFNPEVVRGYSSSLFFMAQKMIKDGVNDISPRTVISSAESLPPFYRETIEEAFGCKVFDYYGSREIGAIAAECEEHKGYHISSENLVLECVKDNEVVKSGEKGEIIITSLRNYGMPFIRYVIGDVGVPSDKTCPCGRGLPLLKSLEGRATQYISVLDKETNQIIPVLSANPGIIPKLFSQVPIETYRIYQEDLEKVVINFVPKPEYTDADTKYLMDFFETNIGKYLDVEINLVDEIPPLPSGKRSVVVSSINPFNDS